MSQPTRDVAFEAFVVKTTGWEKEQIDRQPRAWLRRMAHAWQRMDEAKAAAQVR